MGLRLGRALSIAFCFANIPGYDLTQTFSLYSAIESVVLPSSSGDSAATASTTIGSRTPTSRRAPKSNRLRHEDGQEISSRWVPLPIPEQDPDHAEGCKEPRLHALQDLSPTSVGVAINIGCTWAGAAFPVTWKTQCRGRYALGTPKSLKPPRAIARSRHSEHHSRCSSIGVRALSFRTIPNM